jgi:lysophospholipase L1-like esterase
MRYLALGDSYTIGEGVRPEERWPLKLAALLRQQGFDLNPPQIVAVTGWTTDELSAGIDKAAPLGPFDLVSLLIGVNNQYRGRDLEEYRAQFTALLERAVGFAGGQASQVLVLSIPDWSVTPFARDRDSAAIGGAIAAAIDQFNAVNAGAAQRAGARYVDITPASRLAAGDRGLLAADGLHPSGKQYTEWGRLALPQARAALEQAKQPGG